METEIRLPDILADVVDRMCTEYCKYPELVRSQVKDIGEADDKLIDDYCEHCPLNRLY